MGEVWRAHDAELDRPVAIKRIATERRSDDARVWREARATARLRHPAIVELFEVRKDDDGRPFLVMELIEGVDLATHVRHTGALDAVEAARMVLPILGGLAIAHAANIVHRDLKPENVLLARLSDGSVQPKIVDFGIAQMLEAGTRLTVGLLGTPETMAPEQLELGLAVGPAADLWAVCVTLYFLVAARMPFGGDDLATVFRSIRSSPVPYPRDVAMPGELFAILAKGMRKKPEHRHASASEMRALLVGWLLERGVDTDITGRSIRPARAPAAPPVQREPTLDDLIADVLVRRPS